MKPFVERVETYRSGLFQEKKSHYATLASSQSPKTLLVTCSDSRLCPQEMTESEAGDLFVIRNAGNLIPGYDPENPSNEGLTIEYGVEALGVEEIVVCGHASCGAMGGLSDLSALDALPLVQKGLEKYKDAHSEAIDGCQSVPELIAWNVDNQLDSLLGYPFIVNKIKSGDLKLVGIVYDFVNGNIVHSKTVDSI